MDEVLNGTMAEAVEKLAALAAYHRTGPVEKVAAPDWLASLGEQVKTNPALSHALVGGGLGALALGGNTALNNRGQDPSRKKSILGSALTGGIAGAGAGAGVGVARQGLAGLKGTGDGISGSDALRPGQFVDPATGKRMMIDPQALKDNPQLHEQVRALTTPTFQSRVVGGLGAAADFVREKVPTTGPLALGAAGIDAAMHNPLFGLSRISPEQASGKIGTRLLQAGAKADDVMSPQMREALLRNAKPGGTMPGPAVHPTPLLDAGKPTGGHTGGTFHELHDTNLGVKDRMRGMLNKLREKAPALFGRPNNPGVADLVGGRASSTGGTRPVLSTHYAPEKEVKVTTGKGTGHESTSSEMHVQPKKVDTLNEGHAARLKADGHGTAEGLKGRNLFRTFGRTYAGAGSMGGALGGRAALYGAPVLGEYIARGVNEDTQNRQTLQEIMAKYQRPVPERQGGR